MADLNVSDAIASLKIETCEMHTCGEPLRIIEKGFPKIEGKNIFEKMEYIRGNLDYVRKFLMSEPRGHHDMFGVIQVEPDQPEADIAVIFIHNEGYASMCGHAVISLGRYCIEKGLVSPQEPETKILIQCPCGLVPVHVTYKHGISSRVRFCSVPAFVFAEDVKVKIEDKEELSVDISYGGSFFALVASDKLGIELKQENTSLAMKLGSQVLQAARKTIRPEHPVHQGLSYLFGAIIYDASKIEEENVVKVAVIFGDNQLDRSPCGSGSTSISAYLHKKGLMKQGDMKTFQTIVTNSKFAVQVVESDTYANYDSIRVEVSGIGHFIGHNTYTAEASDPLHGGFLLNRS